MFLHLSVRIVFIDLVFTQTCYGTKSVRSVVDLKYIIKNNINTKGYKIMTKKLFLLLVANILFSSLAYCEWQQQYKPSKLEWAVIELNSMFRTQCIRPTSKDYCLGVTFVASAPSTVILIITTSGEVPLKEY